jgi:hypothetical protein
MNGVYTYNSSKSEFTVTQRELGEFSNRFPETAGFRNRIAEFFWFNLYALEKDQGVDPSDVLREIIALESSTKTFRKPTPFDRKPLKGLMHTHWFSARFIPHNIKYGLGPDGIKNAAEAFFPNGLIEADAIRGFADAITYGAFEQRKAKGGLTGEWIIYAAEDQNYYLCCCGHKSAHHIHKEIIRLARRDFPLLKWFKDNLNVVAQVAAEDLDALLRSGKVKTLNTVCSCEDLDLLLRSLDYDNLETYCNQFLVIMLGALLNAEDLHLLDGFAMQSPKERLFAELQRRGLRPDVDLNAIRAALIKMTQTVVRRG